MSGMCEVLECIFSIYLFFFKFMYSSSGLTHKEKLFRVFHSKLIIRLL